MQVAPGVFGIRLPLPFKLEHVNVYLIDTGSGFALIDAGVRTREAVAAFDAGLAALGIAPTDIVAVVVTHFHVDHIGQAGRLVEPVAVTARSEEHTSELQSRKKSRMPSSA